MGKRSEMAELNFTDPSNEHLESLHVENTLKDKVFRCLIKLNMKELKKVLDLSMHVSCYKLYYRSDCFISSILSKFIFRPPKLLKQVAHVQRAQYALTRAVMQQVSRTCSSVATME